MYDQRPHAKIRIALAVALSVVLTMSGVPLLPSASAEDWESEQIVADETPAEPNPDADEAEDPVESSGPAEPVDGEEQTVDPTVVPEVAPAPEATDPLDEGETVEPVEEDSETVDETEEEGEDAQEESEDEEEVEALGEALTFAVYNNHELRIGWNLPDKVGTHKLVDQWTYLCADKDEPVDASEYNTPWARSEYGITKITVVDAVKLSNASGLFSGMSQLASADLSKLDVSKCMDFSAMFSGCGKLKTLDLSGWSMTTKNIESKNMFNGCKALSAVTVGNGFRWVAALPSYEVNGHKNWYSTKAKAWLTAAQIRDSRDAIADTYEKTGPANAPSSEPTKTPATPAAKVPNVQYRVHRQTYGWETSWRKNGTSSGTTGQSKRLEGICIKLSNKPAAGGISYRTHVQTYGWQDWVSNGVMSGTTGEAKRLEAIQIELTGKLADTYDVWYRVHAQRFGWMGWAKNGEKAGTAGYGYRLEAIQIRLIKKGDKIPGSTSLAFCQRKRSSLSASERIAQMAEHIAEHDKHGYSQETRLGDGTTEWITFTDGTSFAIHGGDYDCSEMARMCANAGKGYNAISSMWSVPADSLLRAAGFTRVYYRKSAAKRGDVLWAPGHMGVALGDNLQADAHGDEVHGFTGPRKGDQTGHEIEVRSLSYPWYYAYRYNGRPKALLPAANL